jgi:hypothetical protein
VHIGSEERIQVMEPTVRLPNVERRRLDSKRRVGCGVVELVVGAEAGYPVVSDKSRSRRAVHLMGQRRGRYAAR